jgi:hypothetical protein
MPRRAFACKGVERGLCISIEGKGGLVEPVSHLQSFQFSRWCLRGDWRFADDRKEEAQVARRACHRANDRKVQISDNTWRRHRASLQYQSIGSQKLAGTRIEPPILAPISNAVMPAATAAADPPEGPRGVRVRSQGLFVVQ